MSPGPYSGRIQAELTNLLPSFDLLGQSRRLWIEVLLSLVYPSSASRPLEFWAISDYAVYVQFACMRIHTNVFFKWLSHTLPPSPPPSALSLLWILDILSRATIANWILSLGCLGAQRSHSRSLLSREIRSIFWGYLLRDLAVMNVPDGSSIDALLYINLYQIYSDLNIYTLTRTTTFIWRPPAGPTPTLAPMPSFPPGPDSIDGGCFTWNK